MNPVSGECNSLLDGHGAAQLTSSAAYSRQDHEPA